MKKGSTWFLRLTVFVLGLAALAICIFALPAVGQGNPPGYPGLSTILLPSLIGIGATVIPFLIALYETLKLLKAIDKNTAFSETSVKSLKRIKQCGIAMFALYAVSLMPLFFIVADGDDAPGLVIVGAVITGAPIVVSVFAAVLQRLLRNAIDMKSENELTV